MIKIDSREPEKISKYFKEEGIECEVIALPVGDILYEERGIVVERKSYSDLISSIKSQHIFKQLLQMEQFPHPYLIITGNYDDLHFTGCQWTSKQNSGSLASLGVRFPKIRIITLPNDRQFVDCVIAIINKTDDGKQITIRDTELLRNSLTTDDIKLRLITCFDGIGIKKGQKYLKDEKINNLLDNLIKEVQGNKNESI